VRRECFQQIGGFVASRGWDTIDEIKAQAGNWKTCHFPKSQVQHLKPEGSARGWLKTQLLHGEVIYLSGGSGLLLFLKALYRAVTVRPLLFAGSALFWGYIKPFILRTPRLVTPDEARLHRRLQYARLRPRSAAN
jgi:poly-beta-1,6-N-acetyl-D-glucosamine synthase